MTAYSLELVSHRHNRNHVGSRLPCAKRRFSYMKRPTRSMAVAAAQATITMIAMRKPSSMILPGAGRLICLERLSDLRGALTAVMRPIILERSRRECECMDAATTLTANSVKEKCRSCESEAMMTQQARYTDNHAEAVINKVATQVGHGVSRQDPGALGSCKLLSRHSPAVRALSPGRRRLGCNSLSFERR